MNLQRDQHFERALGWWYCEIQVSNKRQVSTIGFLQKVKKVHPVNPKFDFSQQANPMGAQQFPPQLSRKKILGRTGAFERRTKQAYHLELTSRQASGSGHNRGIIGATPATCKQSVTVVGVVAWCSLGDALDELVIQKYHNLKVQIVFFPPFFSATCARKFVEYITPLSRRHFLIDRIHHASHVLGRKNYGNPDRPKSYTQKKEVIRGYKRL